MVKPNKRPKTKHKSSKQVNEPLVDTERDLPQKERIDLTKNKSRTVAETDSDIQNCLKQPPPLTNLAAMGELSLVDQPKDVDTLPSKASPTRRDLAVLIRNSEQAEDSYDTEGKVGPFFHAQKAEGVQDFVKTPLLEEQEEEPPCPLNQNKLEDHSTVLPSTSPTIDKISKQNVSWIHREFWL